MIKIFGALLMGCLLASCAAIEKENSSPDAIPPARPDPFGGGVGSSAPPPELGGTTVAGQ